MSRKTVWKRKRWILLCLVAVLFTTATGCTRADEATQTVSSAPGESEPAESDQPGVSLEDGIYEVDFDTDGSMFHVNEACEGKGTLTVKEGEMVLHISLPSKNVINLFPGSAEDAVKEGAVLLQPTIDTVTYSDGMTEEVHGFDIPVTVIGEEFDLAILGTKGKWYDHKVILSNPQKRGGCEEYKIPVSLEGGSGRATILSPAVLFQKEGTYFVRIEWSSPHYDYMKIGDEKYEPVNADGNSVFELPVDLSKDRLTVIADTTAMGTPHEIEYVLVFDFDPVKAESALIYDHSLALDYATEFSVDYYEGGYARISVSDGSRFLVVPEGAAQPEDIAKDTVILRQPVNDIYLAASAVMDMFVSMDALDRIALSGTKEDGWYIAAAKDAMAEGRIQYAGKYNMPDYERIVDTGCPLAIESTMLLHAPQVQENLENLGIAVLIDRSSYESHPLGRTEWVKLYGALLGKEKEAQAAFERQKSALEEVSGEEKTGKTAAFFYITSGGMVNVRKSQDYVPKMIELAGGRYIFDKLEDDTASSTVTMTLEEFYLAAKDADFLIYNSTVGGKVPSMEALVGDTPVLADFQAVKEKRVFCTTQNFYQESMKTGTFIADVHRMLREKESEDAAFHYLYRLE